ncbi:MAG: VapE family protein [Chitinophagales bacterium]
MSLNFKDELNFVNSYHSPSNDYKLLNQAGFKIGVCIAQNEIEHDSALEMLNKAIRDNLKLPPDKIPKILKDCISSVELGIEKAYPPKQSKKKDRNLLLEIQQHVLSKYDFKRNIISNRLEKENGEELTIIETETIYWEICRDYGVINKNLFHSLLNSNQISSYNPIKQYIENSHENCLIASDTPEIRKLISAIKTSERQTLDYKTMIVMKWLVGLIANCFSPKETNSIFLILCGKKNTGKTEFFRRLLPEPLRKYMAETNFDQGKDSELLMAQKLILLIDELPNMNRKDQKAIRALITTKIISQRVPYDRYTSDHVRIASLCATTNDFGIIDDPYNNRRTAVIEVEEIDFNLYNDVNKDKLLAEAYYLYLNKFDWYISQKDMELFDASNVSYEITKPEKEALNALYSVPESNLDYNVKKLTCTEISNVLLEEYKIKVPIVSIGKALRELGFVSQRIRLPLTDTTKTSQPQTVYFVVQNPRDVSYSDDSLGVCPPVSLADESKIFIDINDV